MFRAVVFAFVLAWAIGPNISLLCPVWCHPARDAVPVCEHHQNATASSRITGADRCRATPADVAAVLRGDAKRESLVVGVHQAIAGSRFESDPRPDSSVRRHEAARSFAGDAPPLLIALRI